MLLDGQPFWSRENLLYLMVLFCFIVVVGGAMGWVILQTHNLRQRARLPGGVGTALFYAWVVWAFLFSRLLLPESFALRSVVDGFLLRDWSLLPLAIVWGVGVAVIPAALLFGGLWLSAQFVRRRLERKRTEPWRKFEPIGYRLNWKRIFSIPAVVIYDRDRDNPVITTVGSILNEILPGRFNVPGEPRGEMAPVPDSKEFMGEVDVTAPNGRFIEVVTIRGGDVVSKRFAAELVDGVLTLFRITEKVSDCMFWFHESDDWFHMGSWGTRHKFFVVHDDTIVIEKFELSSLCDDFFDHLVLRPMYEKEDWKKALGRDDDHDDGDEGETEGELTPGQKTGVRWWYRRFYTETRTGKMKVFWDEPLFSYVPPEHMEAQRDARLRRVEWFVLGIAGLLVAHYFLKWF